MPLRHQITISLVLLTTLFLASTSQARSPEESEFVAAKHLGEDIARWVMKRDPQPASLAVFSIHSNPPLDQEFSSLLETEIIKHLTELHIDKVTSCGECRTTKVAIEGDKVVITKGAPDVESLKKMGSKLPVETLLMVEVFRSKLNVMAQVVLYENNSGTLLGSESFKQSAITFSDTAVQVLMTFGLGRTITEITTAPPGFAMAGNLSLLEELGFGKGGLNIGFISGGGSSLLYVNPTLAFRGRFGTSAVGFSFNPGVGYGFTGESKGITARLGFEIYLGNITVLGVEGTYLFPDDPSIPTLRAFYGLHLGLSLGK